MEISSARLDQPVTAPSTAVLANGQPRPPHKTEVDEINLAQVVRFFQRHFRLLTGAALIAGITTAVVLFFSPRAYEASVILVVSPSKFSSELKPATLTVQGYQKLLESDAVLAETKKRLIEQNVLNARDLFRVGNEIETRIFVSRTSETTSLAPMIQAVALRARMSAQAAAIANTWAQVFLDRLREITVGSTAATVRFLEDQYPQARERLLQLETERATTADAFQKRYNEAATRWDQKLTAFKNETADQLANYQGETARLLTESEAQSLDTDQAKAGASRGASGTPPSAHQNAALQQKLQQIIVLRLQLLQTPQYLTLEKTMGDDPLWLATALQKSRDTNLDTLQGRSLRTQERNPAYTELVFRLAQLESEVSGLNVEDTKTFRRVLATLEQFQRTREASLFKLKEQRNLESTALDRERKSELDSITREQDVKLGQLKQDVAQQRNLYENLAKNYNQAMLAKAQQEDEDVRLGAAAVPPDSPQSRGLVMKSVLAAFLGGLLALLIALVHDVVASVTTV